MKRNDHVVRYESYDQKIRPVITFTVSLTVLTLLVLWLMRLSADALTRRELEGSKPIHPLAGKEVVEAPLEPPLQENPALDLAALRAREDERLSTYGWVDRANGIVRIPIERAMELVAREGLPLRKEAR